MDKNPTRTATGQAFRLAFLFLVSWCGLAVAETENQGETNLYFYTGAVSAHTKENTQGGPYNENHDLAAVQYGRYAAGYFLNSFYDDTFFMNYTRAIQIEGVSLAGFIGVNYGYRKCVADYELDSRMSKKVCPDLGAGLIYNRFFLQPAVLFRPKVFFFTVRWRFVLE